MIRSKLSLSVLSLFVSILFVPLFFACSPRSAPPAPAAGGAAAAGAGGGSYQESPFTAEKVKAGQLPPIEQRLPKQPVVVNKNSFSPGTMDTWVSGKHGGEIRLSHNEPNNAPDVFFVIMQPIIRMPNGLSDGAIQDNICHFLGASGDRREFTFKIREELRWSDGQPVTTEDVRFAYEDVSIHPDLNPSVPFWLNQEGKAGKLTILDDYTFCFSFEKPFGGFIRNVMVNQWVEYSRIIKPAHYLKQFHGKYASSEDIQKRVADAKLGSGSTWQQLFLLMDSYNRNITSRTALGMPMLTPWYLASIENEVFVYERNPYYYKVDSEGKQLPYIDRIISPKVQDGEMENMRMISGEADVLRRNAALIKLPLYKENEAQGKYTTLMLNSHLDAPSIIYFNFSYPDKSIRDLFLDVRFRTAVSLGIDKKEIIDSVYLGFGSIPTYTRGEFDPAEANRLLDEMGMKIGRDGYRMTVDGKPFVFLIENAGEAVDLPAAAEIAAAHLKENLKLNAVMKKSDTTLFGQAITSNQVQTRVMWAFDHTLEDDYTIRNLFQISPNMDKWMLAKRAGKSTAGDGLIEPPDWLKELYTLYDQRMELTYGTTEYWAHVQKEKDHFYKYVITVPLIEKSMLPLPLSNKFGNTPTGGYQITTLHVMENMFIK